MKRRILILVLVAFFLTACATATPPPQPASAPTTTSVSITHTIELKPNEFIKLKKSDTIWIVFANVIKDRLIGTSVEVTDASNPKWKGWWSPNFQVSKIFFDGDQFGFSLKEDVITITYSDSWKQEGANPQQ